jgi:GTP-binding protein YchF
VKLGIFGFPQVGKTTLFTLLTGAQGAAAAAHRGDPNLGVARVPDDRLAWLSASFKPKKTTPATFECVDIVGLHRGEAATSLNLAVLKPVDALAHVVRSFEDETIPHGEGPIDPKRDVENMEMELIFADLDTVTKRVERLTLNIAKAGRAEDKKELPLQQQIKAWLEAGKPIRSMELGPDDQKTLRGFAYYTEKPLLLLLNVGEGDVSDLDAALRKAGLEEAAAKPKVVAVAASAKIEQEMALLSEKDAEAFRADLGLKESALQRILHGAYGLLGLISFYTVGEDECRAWPIRRGTTAAKAAGTIHTDFEKGFIRAEVTAYDKYREAGSFPAARDKGWMRLEGKEYVVVDGDIVHFRFAL